jgi:hypothetical protein
MVKERNVDEKMIFMEVRELIKANYDAGMSVKAISFSYLNSWQH